jgi:hypothetical protein
LLAANDAFTHELPSFIFYDIDGVVNGRQIHIYPFYLDLQTSLIYKLAGVDRENH